MYNKQCNTYFHTSESIEALYFALPDVVWKLVLAVCFGTGTLTTTPSANILAPKTLLTFIKKKNKVHVSKIRLSPTGTHSCTYSYFHVDLHACSAQFLDCRQNTEWKVYTLCDSIPTTNLSITTENPAKVHLIVQVISRDKITNIKEESEDLLHQLKFTVRWHETDCLFWVKSC